MLPKRIKILMYNAFFLSQINYCILAWGFKIDEIETYQKSIVRIISNSSYSAHSEPLMKDLNILKLSDIFELNKTKFYYKYQHHELPEYFQNFDFKLNSDIHDHKTRGKENIHTNKVKRVFADLCIRNDIAHFINNLSTNIKNKIETHSLRFILKRFKKEKIKTYNFICNERNCYSCNN